MTKLQADWLNGAFLQKITTVLGPDNIRFVGGAVRDTLVSRPIKDIDAASVWPPQKTKELLEASGVKVFPTGMDHGTVTAVCGGDTVEITTLRHDVETDGRHAKVAFTDNWLEDAKRRDFTMNAIYLSPDGTLFDPFEGANDLENGRVRFIGDPDARIKEDALRILRFFRFHAHFGVGAMDATGMAAIKANAALLEGLSVERVRDEICKLLAAPDPLGCVQAMADADIWSYTPIPAPDFARLATVLDAEKTLDIEPDILVRLAALAGRRAASVGRALKMSGREIKDLTLICLGLESDLPVGPHEMKTYIYRHGKIAAAAVLLAHAGALDTADDRLALLRDWEVPVFPVRGRHLLALGMEPGPGFSRTLEELEQIWIESDFQLKTDALLGQLSS